MIKHTESLAEKESIIQARLNLISTPYDDTLFMDMSLNSKEYRVVRKSEDRYLLYVTYPRLRFFGTILSSYKFVFSTQSLDDNTVIVGRTRLKNFLFLFIALWYGSVFFMLFVDISKHNYSKVSFIIFSSFYMSAWLLTEFYFFRKKVKTFFVLLTKEPPKEITDSFPATSPE